jgi:predicted Ser/Thr protein kinase
MERYSREPQGALYRFNWIFPSEKLAKGTLGFQERPAAARDAEPGSYAHLEGKDIDARLVCELQDHPLLLLPRAERRALLESSLKAVGAEDFVVAHYLLEGELCQKCRKVFDALLAAHQGDLREVLRHVQVERFYVDRRYQNAAVTVEPQLSVDAGYRQLTADRSIANLPSTLQNLALFEPHGPLASANRGLIEYSDLLKRPLEAFKYLLGASETGQVSMEQGVLQLDQVFVATSNDKHLNAFKELPDFASFKGRIELVRVPYLRRFSVEQEVYDQQVTPAAVGGHVAPHATRVAAMWAVLTRLKKPLYDRYQGELKDLVDDLSPVEKLLLYDRAEVPDRLAMQQARLLRGHLSELYRESDAYPRYEGGGGASAREIKTALFNAMHAEASCLTPLAVLEELRALVKDKSVYEFLQQEVVDGYHDHEALVAVVEEEWLDLIDEEIRDSLGLVSEAQHRELFERYVLHVSHWTKGENLLNRITGKYEPASESQMTEMESIIMGSEGGQADFRRSLISAVGAYKLDHPDDAVDYARAFPDLFRKLRDHYFDERKKVLRRGGENVLRFLAHDPGELAPREIAQVEQTLATMKKRYRYCGHCAKEAIVFLMKKRYAG